MNLALVPLYNLNLVPLSSVFLERQETRAPELPDCERFTATKPLFKGVAFWAKARAGTKAKRNNRVFFILLILVIITFQNADNLSMYAILHPI